MSEGDVYLFNNADGGEIEIENGLISINSGFSTSVYVALFSDGNWWGNEINSDEQKIKSELNNILDRKLNNQTRLDSIEFAKEALKWMIEQNIAKTIDIEAFIININTLSLEISITKPDQETINLKYEINWQKQFANPIGS